LFVVVEWGGGGEGGGGGEEGGGGGGGGGGFRVDFGCAFCSRRSCFAVFVGEGSRIFVVPYTLSPETRTLNPANGTYPES